MNLTLIKLGVLISIFMGVVIITLILLEKISGGEKMKIKQQLTGWHLMEDGSVYMSSHMNLNPEEAKALLDIIDKNYIFEVEIDIKHK